MDADRPTLRALLWCSATALQRLTRTMAIACVPCLLAEHHSNTEPVNITLTEYNRCRKTLSQLISDAATIYSFRTFVDCHREELDR